MVNRLIESHCHACGKDRDKKYFATSIIDGRLLPYCNTCINTIYRQNIGLTGGEEAGLWLLCAKLDLPYINDIAQQAIKASDSKNADVFKNYYNGLKSGDMSYKGFVDSNLMLDDLMPIVKDIEEEEPENSVEKRKQRELIWGVYSEDGEYEYLESLFESYTADVIISSTAQELMYRDLCKANLRKRVADESGDITEISKAQANVKDLLKSLKIDDFASGNQSDVEKFVERKAWMIENTRPCECEDLEKYKDFSGFEKPFKDIMRCVKNLVSGSREYPDIPKSER